MEENGYIYSKVETIDIWLKLIWFDLLSYNFRLTAGENIGYEALIDIL